MADTIQTLLVSLEARIAGYEREMKRAVGISNKSAKSIESRFQSMNRNVSNTAGQLSGALGRAFAGAAALRGAQILIDASTRIENSLKVTGLAGEELSVVYDSIFKSAQKNFAPLETLATLYSRLGLAQKELGASNSDLLSFTDNIALALRVQGAGAQESSGALIQLTQALGSGTVRAEEFNSILEGAPTIARAAAAGLTEAGGSVAKLRALVIEGKISSEAFFDAFQAGAPILTGMVASAELTVSQGFVRLQNVLIDTAGKFDNATNASQRIAGVLQQLSNSIEGAGAAADKNGPAINRFLDFISKAGNDLGDSMFAGTVKEFEQIAGVVDAATQSFDRYGSSVTDAELATAAAEQALVNFGANTQGQFGELQPVIDDFIQQLLEGRGTALSAAEAIDAIGAAGDFGALTGQLAGLVTSLFAVRSEAVATAAAVAAAARGDTSGSNIAGQRAEQLSNRPKPAVKPVSLKDYKVPDTPGSGGGGKSPGETFADALAKQAEENRLLTEKTAIQSTLNPLVDDYGFAMERLKVQQDLQTAATTAGISLTPALKASIDELALGYANASVEASQLAESQQMAQQTADEFKSIASDTTKGFISDLLDGKSAVESLENALGNLSRKLLDMAMNQVINNLFKNLLGSIGGGSGKKGGSLFGFADGGYTGDGGKNQPAGVVHKGEYVFTKAQTAKLGAGNLARLAKGYANGGLVGSPSPVSSAASPGGMHITVGVSADSAGNLTPFVENVSMRQAAKVTAAASPRIVEQSKAAVGSSIKGGDYDGGLSGRYGISSQARRR